MRFASSGVLAKTQSTRHHSGGVHRFMYFVVERALDVIRRYCDPVGRMCANVSACTPQKPATTTEATARFWEECIASSVEKAFQGDATISNE